MVDPHLPPLFKLASEWGNGWENASVRALAMETATIGNIS
jgi:hypothetical protein